MSHDPNDKRHHLSSMLMRESLVDKGVMASTETPVARMLPDCFAVKVGGGSIMDQGRARVLPLVAALAEAIKTHRMVIGVGGGARSRHVFSIGTDLGLPTGVLAQLAIADALGNAHILGTLLAPYGAVAIPPEMFGHLLPLFVRSVPAVICSGDPPYSLWEHPPEIGRIPPHRSDTGMFLTAECFGCKGLIYVKDVAGVYDRDPHQHSDATLIPRITVGELRERKLKTLPFDRALIDILDRARLVRSFQVIDGRRPELLAAALAGEHVGTIVSAD